MSEQPDGPDLTQGVDVSALKEGAMIAGRVGDKAVILARSEGLLFAVGASCTHVGAPLQDGLVEAGTLRCPWHHARFDLRSGKATGAPAFEPLGCFVVEEAAGQAYVKGPKTIGLTLSPPAAETPHVVILGGGAGGFACADWLVRSGFKGRTTLISEEADPPYDRTFCSKDYLEGKAPRSDCSLAARNFYADAKLDLKLSTQAKAIDLQSKTVTVDPGGKLKFDFLVLAAGCAPKAAEFAGADHANVHRLRTLRDADALIAEMGKSRRAAVIGASFIGLEIAAALVERGLQVHVVASEEVLLKPVMGEAVGRFVQRLHVEKGVIFHLGNTVERFDGSRLEITDGTVLDVDFVAVGLGVSPRVELAQTAGLMVDDGVHVDGSLKASVDSVYAVGDVANYPDPLTGERTRVEHWVHAQRQGQHVARAILGENAAFTDIPFFWSAHYGTGVRFVGRSQGFDTVEIEGDLEAVPATEVVFKARYHRNGILVAAATYNNDLASLEDEIGFERRIAVQASG